MTPRTANTLALIACAAGLTLAACGKQGELERPAPMWGAENKAKYEAEKRAEAEAREREKQEGRSTVRPNNQDNTTVPAPARTLPIEGQSPDPSASPQRGSLPDPYARPE